MLRLGGDFWLDATAAGWVLLRVHEKPKRTERFGPYTSPRHVLQQRQVALPKRALAAVREIVRANEAGEAMLDEMPEAGE